MVVYICITSTCEAKGGGIPWGIHPALYSETVTQKTKQKSNLLTRDNSTVELHLELLPIFLKNFFIPLINYVSSVLEL